MEEKQPNSLVGNRIGNVFGNINTTYLLEDSRVDYGDRKSFVNLMYTHVYYLRKYFAHIPRFQLIIKFYYRTFDPLDASSLRIVFLIAASRRRACRSMADSTTRRTGAMTSPASSPSCWRHLSLLLWRCAGDNNKDLTHYGNWISVKKNNLIRALWSVSGWNQLLTTVQ